MKTHSNFTSRIFGILAIATVGWLQPTAAYGQIAEGTVIVNTATVSFSDANSNTYSTVDGVANVTVGHVPGIDVVAAAATATPVSPSTNTMSFDVINIGNGVDTLSVSETISDGTVLSVNKFTYDGTDYANIGLLNTALADSTVVAGDTITIVVEYDVASDKGGEPSTYTLTGTSVRDGSATDNDNTVVTPVLTGSVVVTPDGGETLTHLPNSVGVPTYTFQFSVTNNQTGGDDFDLLVTSPGSSVITIVSVNAFAGDSTRVTFAASELKTIDVIYSVAGAAAAQDTLYLEARSVAAPATTNSGFADMTVIEADLAITKVAYDTDYVSPIGLVVPGDFIEYKVTVTNNGAAQAASVVVTDNLPATLTYISRLNDVGTWDVTGSGNNRTFTLNPGTLNAAASVSFFIRAQVN